MSMQAETEIMNLAEAAAFLRCSKAHVSHMVNGKVHGIAPLPAVRLGRRIIFRRSSLQQWVAVTERQELLLRDLDSTLQTPERKTYRA